MFFFFSGVSIASCGLSKNPGIFMAAIKLCITGIWDTRNNVRWGHGELLDQSNRFSYQNYTLTEAHWIMYVSEHVVSGQSVFCRDSTPTRSHRGQPQNARLSSLRVLFSSWVTAGPTPPLSLRSGLLCVHISQPRAQGGRQPLVCFNTFISFSFLILVNSL